MSLQLSAKSVERIINRKFKNDKIKATTRWGITYLTEETPTTVYSDRSERVQQPDGSFIRTSNGICILKKEQTVSNQYKPGDNILSLRWSIVKRDHQKQIKEFQTAIEDSNKQKRYEADQASAELKELFKDMSKSRFSWLKN